MYWTYASGPFNEELLSVPATRKRTRSAKGNAGGKKNKKS